MNTNENKSPAKAADPASVFIGSTLPTPVGSAAFIGLTGAKEKSMKEGGLTANPVYPAGDPAEAQTDSPGRQGSGYFGLAVEICHNSRRQGLEAMHQAISDALDARLDPPSDEEPLDPEMAPCNCPDDRCRC